MLPLWEKIYGPKKKDMRYKECLNCRYNYKNECILEADEAENWVPECQYYSGPERIKDV